MKISDLMESMITEAARFGNAEKSMVMKNIDNFLIGIEYEFNVDDKWGAIDNEVITGAEFAAWSKVDYLTDQIGVLGRAYAAIYSNTPPNVMRGIQSRLEDALEGFGGINRQDATSAEFFAINFLQIMRASKELIDGIPTAKSVKGIGLYKNITRKEVAALERIIKNSSRLSFGDSNIPSFSLTDDAALPMIDQLFAEDVIEMFSVWDKHIRGEAKLIRQTMTRVQVIDVVRNALRKNVVAKITPQGATTKVEWVRDNIGKYVDYSKISEVMADPSVPRGVEVITKPLKFSDAIKTMDEVFTYISRVGGTSELTGLHINVSYRGQGFSRMNAVKALTLIDDYELSHGDGGSRGGSLRWAKRRVSAEPNHRVFVEKGDGPALIYTLAKEYATKGPDAFIKMYEDILIRQGREQKYVSFNLKSFFGDSVSERRVEWRVMGGTDYHKRKSEVVHDILHVCFVILAGMDEKFLRKEYLKSIVRMLNKITMAATKGQRNFVDLIGEMRS